VAASNQLKRIVALIWLNDDRLQQSNVADALANLFDNVRTQWKMARFRHIDSVYGNL
jgi:hypothetical protein